MDIRFCRSPWDEKDIKYVNKVIKRGVHWANGPEINEFENKILEFIGKKYCVVFNSRTSALHSVLHSYDIKNRKRLDQDRGGRRRRARQRVGVVGDKGWSGGYCRQHYM